MNMLSSMKIPYKSERKLSIPFDEIKSPVARDGEAWAAPVPTSVYQIIPDHANWIFMEASSDTTWRPLDPEFVIGQSLQAHELVEAYGKGRLKGQLKEIATTLEKSPIR